MSSIFESSFDYIMKWEGGYSNISEDRGGATNFGISTRFLKSLKKDDILPTKDMIEKKVCDFLSLDRYIKDMSVEQAKWIYKKYFWLDSYDKFLPIHASYIFDMAVNHGHKTAHTIFQRGLRSCGVIVKDDGFIGNITLAAYSSIFDSAYSMSIELKTAMKSERAGYMRAIVATDPSQRLFLNGWLRRAYCEG